MTGTSQTPDTAVVVVNLGTPSAPTAAAVRRYLGEFLSDRRVVSLPPLLWQPLLRGVILPLRAPRVAPKYASVWLDGGSPLAVYTAGLARAMRDRMPGVRVLDAMRYGEPSLARLLQRLRDDGLRRVLVLPLYPQYSTTTTASVGDVLARADGPALRMVDDYHLAPEWVAAVAGSVRAHRAERDDGGHLLFSFHGLPQRVADAGDPYPQQCEASARAIAAALGLPDHAWSLSYQSRFGRERWLEPATDATLDALAARGIRTVDVIAPGFSVDCLETLEEVSMMLAERFAERGGTLRYIPCLNDSPAHADAMAAVARRALDAWA
ncbi:ferrochelatase [Lysobacter arseniciresistens ZS79]|uniref:Ferrochelatase n=1 Tax=Lysobacter arseniciresistens ZS79 TaxID=913325 RepID=A0A0A0ET61_9GAMM|nr:ferrochelatase [Lysobacter arseniciresistens]KGM53303.1 ferrochelatase [Lysobacter arseniciresistens ZS79]